MNMLSDIAGRLNAKTIHEVRVIARAVGARSDSSQKSSVVEAILAVAENKISPQPPSKRGAPPKSENADTALVADIKACREYYIALASGEAVQTLFVSDGNSERAFSNLTHIFPQERLNLNSDIQSRIVDFFAPVVLGQRVFLTGGSKTGKTSLLKSIAGSICGNYPEVKQIFLLINARPEEITDYKRSFAGAEIFSATFDMPAARMASEAMLAFDCARKEVENGHDAVIFADGLLDGYVALETVKKLLFCACNAEEGGSLTAITALPKNYQSYSDVINTANSIITLSSELAKLRIFPAIDAKKCYLDREQDVLNRDEIAAIRAIYRQLSSEQIIELFKSTDNNGQIIEKYKNG